MIEGITMWREGHRYMIAERMLTSLVRMIPEEYPDISEVKLYVSAIDEAAMRLFGRLGFISPGGQARIPYSRNLPEHNELALNFKVENQEN